MAAPTSKSAKAEATAGTISLIINSELDFEINPDHSEQFPPPYDSNSTSTSIPLRENNTDITMTPPDAAVAARLASVARYNMDLEAQAEAERSCCEFSLIFGKVAACGALALIFLFALGILDHTFSKKV